MQERPLFSVLIAQYNNAPYLMQAIESIRQQDYTNYEIIIVDDSSTDNSHDIYKTLADDPKIHIYYNEKNMGVGYTKHQCVLHSTGQICGFVDPDDVLYTNKALSVMVQKHKEHPECSLIYSNSYMTDIYLNITEKCQRVSFPESTTILDERGWGVGHFATFKRSYYDMTEGIDTIMHCAVDYDMYYKLEEVGKIMLIEDFLYLYRGTDRSISLNDNVYKARVWHSYACINAMRRRGLRDQSLMLFPIEYERKEMYEKGQESIRHTHAYRLGHALLAPIRWIKKK